MATAFSRVVSHLTDVTLLGMKLRGSEARINQRFPQETLSEVAVLTRCR